MSDLCDCGRYRSDGRPHECYFVTADDWRLATEKRLAAARAPEVRYEPLVWKAWNMAIEEDAWREVEAEFPEMADV